MALTREEKLQAALQIAADYFPDALIELADVCRAGNQQHNGDNPVLYWDRTKSADHFTKGIRHWTRRGSRDDDNTLHIGKACWRALADSQLECEKAGAPLAPAALRAPMLHARAAEFGKFLRERAESDDDAPPAYDAKPLGRLLNPPSNDEE